MNTCSAIGCFEPRHRSVGGYEYAYCYQHWLERMEAYKVDDSTGETTMKSDICKVDGCNEPRMRNKSGELLTMCEQHQREYWKDAAAKQAAKKKDKVAKAAAPKVSNITIKTTEPTYREARPNDVTPDDSKPFNTHDCDHCTAKATIEALRAKSPKLAKLIDAMQAEVEAAQELGL